MLHVASPPPGRSRQSHAPRSTPSLNGEGLQCGVVVGCAPPRVPPQRAPRVLFVYDNNIGIHRIAKRTRWVLPTRRRRADLSDRGRGRRVVGRTFPRGGRATAEGRGCVTRGGECGGETRRFTSGAKKRRLSFYWSKSRN